MPDGAELEWIRNRVNLPTAKNSREIARDIDPRILARSFISARVCEAHLQERFRQTLDDYLSGRISRDKARADMRVYARKHGKDDGTESMKNLCGTARLNLILDQNRKMARAVGDYEQMFSESALEAFPYVRFRASVGSKKPRPEHQKLDGMIREKTDPYVLSHWPPLDFGCNCRWEECSRKKAERDPIGPRKPMPKERAEREFNEKAKSGFVFDPRHTFEENDISSLTPVSRASIIKDAEEAVRDQKLGSVGMITAPPLQGRAIPVHDIPEIGKVKAGFDAMKDAARIELESAGLDPDNLPDYETVNKVFGESGRQGKNIPGAVIEKFPEEPFEVTKLNQRAAESAGLPGIVPVMLGRGNAHYGIEHLWRNHKELFVDPETAIRLLKETLGNPNCRVVVSLKRAMADVHVAGKKVKKPICLKRIVLHNPETQTYCVMVWDGKQLKLVSWNNAGDDYGNTEWVLK